MSFPNRSAFPQYSTQPSAFVNAGHGSICSHCNMAAQGGYFSFNRGGRMMPHSCRYHPLWPPFATTVTHALVPPPPGCHCLPMLNGCPSVGYCYGYPPNYNHLPEALLVPPTEAGPSENENYHSRITGEEKDSGYDYEAILARTPEGFLLRYGRTDYDGYSTKIEGFYCHSNGEKCVAEKTSAIKNIGDVIVAVDGISMKGKSYAEVCERIELAEFDITLRLTLPLEELVCREGEDALIRNHFCSQEHLDKKPSTEEKTSLQASILNTVNSIGNDSGPSASSYSYDPDEISLRSMDKYCWTTPAVKERDTLLTTASGNDNGGEPLTSRESFCEDGNEVLPEPVCREGEDALVRNQFCSQEHLDKKPSTEAKTSLQASIIDTGNSIGNESGPSASSFSYDPDEISLRSMDKYSWTIPAVDERDTLLTKASEKDNAGEALTSRESLCEDGKEVLPDPDFQLGKSTSQDGSTSSFDTQPCRMTTKCKGDDAVPSVIEFIQPSCGEDPSPSTYVRETKRKAVSQVAFAKTDIPSEYLWLAYVEKIYALDGKTYYPATVVSPPFLDEHKKWVVGIKWFDSPHYKQQVILCEKCSGPLFNEDRPARKRFATNRYKPNVFKNELHDGKVESLGSSSTEERKNEESDNNTNNLQLHRSRAAFVNMLQRTHRESQNVHPDIIENGNCHICKNRRLQVINFGCEKTSHSFCEAHAKSRLMNPDLLEIKSKLHYCPICCFECRCAKCLRDLDILWNEHSNRPEVAAMNELEPSTTKSLESSEEQDEDSNAFIISREDRADVESRDSNAFINAKDDTADADSTKEETGDILNETQDGDDQSQSNQCPTQARCSIRSVSFEERDSSDNTSHGSYLNQARARAADVATNMPGRDNSIVDKNLEVIVIDDDAESNALEVIVIYDDNKAIDLRPSVTKTSDNSPEVVVISDDNEAIDLKPSATKTSDNGPEEFQCCVTFCENVNLVKLRCRCKAMICRSCLKNILRKSKKHLTYDYHGRPENNPQFTIKTHCPRCKQLFSPRTFENMCLDPSRSSVDEEDDDYASVIVLS